MNILGPSLLLAGVTVAHSGLKSITVDGTTYVADLVPERYTYPYTATHRSTLESTTFWARFGELNGLTMFPLFHGRRLPMFRTQVLLVSVSFNRDNTY
jgi:hypothetical protein